MLETTPASASPVGPLRLFLIAGEHSGDALGARLIDALRLLSPRPLELAGVGGELMERRGCPSLFPLHELAVMSPLAILARLPSLWRRLQETVRAALAFQPDVLVILDSPEFTHQVAKRIRRMRPELPIVNYVSPSVWAWRPWRARKMRRYVDHILAILPFEPDVHARLGGPTCSYVGHPMVEKLDWIGSLDAQPLRQRLGIPKGRSVLLVLPGSRASEVHRLMAPFGDALRVLAAQGEPFEVVVPVVESVRALVEDGLRSWPVTPHLVTDEADKFRAFKLATVALAASGTVTLELALSGTPMVIAYKVDALAYNLRFLFLAHSVALPNLILGARVFPEFLHQDCSGEKLAGALAPLMHEGPERDAQRQGLAKVIELVRETGDSPTERAARLVLSYADRAAKSAPSNQRASIGT